jgi:hypothetical protein
MGVPQRLVSLALLLALSGCVLPGNYVVSHQPADPGVGQIAVTWTNRVAFAPDTVHGGTPQPGLTGRLYLFGETMGYPLVGDGGLVVDLFDDAPNGPPGGQHIEQWKIDPATLKRLLRKDTIGQGYTLFLPWATYRPEIKAIHLAVMYQPAQGSPIYAPSGPLTLQHENSPIPQVTSSSNKPVAAAGDTKK